MHPRETYRDLVARLARRHDEFAAERAEVTTWYAQQQAAAEAAVDRAAEAVARADAEVAEARSIAEKTDNEVQRLWFELRARVGQLGKAPEPTPATESGGDPFLLLEEVEARLRRPGRAPREMPGWLSPLLVLFGVVGAGIGYAAAQGARWSALRVGGDFAVFAPVLKQVVTLLAPFLGLIPAKLLADRNEARLDGGKVGVVLVAGLLTLGTLLLAVGR